MQIPIYFNSTIILCTAVGLLSSLLLLLVLGPPPNEGFSHSLTAKKAPEIDTNWSAIWHTFSRVTRHSLCSNCQRQHRSSKAAKKGRQLRAY